MQHTAAAAAAVVVAAAQVEFMPRAAVTMAKSAVVDAAAVETRCVQEQNAETMASESVATRLLTCNGRTMEFEESATFGAAQADLTVRAIT